MAFLKGIDIGALRSTFEAGVKAAQENVANIQVDSILQGARDAVTTGIEGVQGALGELTGRHTGENESSTRELVALLWCLSYVDGVISDEEKETLGELPRALDDTYETYAPEIEQTYATKLSDLSKEFGYQNAAKIAAQSVVESLDASAEDKKLLCWNLLALANADGLDENELNFISFVAEKAGLDPAVFAELHNYSDAIGELGKSINELKMSNQSYSVIEPLVNEFTDRQLEVLDAVQALITDR